MWDPYADFESKVLPNGLTVYASQWPDRKCEKFHFLIHGGALAEAGKAGAAHFLEHLISWGVPGVTSGDIADFFGDVGGSVCLGSTSSAAINFSFFAPCNADFLRSALDLFGRMIFETKVEDKRIESERGIITREFLKKFPNDLSLNMHLRVDKSLFSRTALPQLCLPTLGTMETISSIGMDDLMEYHGRCYVPANVSVLAVGGLKPDEVFSLVAESCLAKSRSGQRFKLPDTQNDIPTPLETRIGLDFGVFSGDAKKKALCLGCSALLPATIKPGLLSIFSRLVRGALDEEIREKRQWTYGTRYNATFRGLFEKVEIDFLDLPLGDKDLIEGVINNVGSFIATNKKEFEKTRDRSVKRLGVMDFSIYEMVDNCVDDLVRCGRIISLEEVKKNMEEMSLVDVSYMLGFFRPERRCTVFEIN